jgi:hypothetical protein
VEELSSVAGPSRLSISRSIVPLLSSHMSQRLLLLDIVKSDTQFPFSPDYQPLNRHRLTPLHSLPSLASLYA